MPQPFDAAAHYQVDPDRFVRREVGGETVLVPVRGGDGVADVEYLYRLNGVGAIVWDALVAGQALGDAVERVLAASDFGPVPETAARVQVEADVAAFVGDLEEAGLARR